MSTITRRQLFQCSVTGLAASGAAAWTLRAGAAPTVATEDVHNYEAYLDKNGIPQIEPAGKWEMSHEDILGPFYVAGAPFRGKVTAPLVSGTPLVIRGRVWGFDTKKPLRNAVLDVWQADAQGQYDMEDPNHPPEWHEFQNRIRLVTDETGYYEYETIKPAAYRIGEAAQAVRPAHIHYLIQAPGYQKLITQLYFHGDEYLKSDRWASKSNLIIATETQQAEKGTYELGTFDIVLAK